MLPSVIGPRTASATLRTYAESCGNGTMLLIRRRPRVYNRCPSCCARLHSYTDVKMAAYQSFLNSMDTDTAQKMPSVTRISKNVVRVLGQNPGKFTLDGTNTYLIGQRNPYILVDTGEGNAEYPPLLQSALQDAASSPDFRPDEADISDIILTHRHMDHCGGVPTILQLLSRRWTARHPISEEAETEAQKSSQPQSPTANGKHSERPPFPAPRVHKFPFSHPQSDAVLHALPRGLFVPTESGLPVHPLREGQIFTISSLPSASEHEKLGQALQVLETPGHTPDSICLFLAADAALFTGDTVLGNSSTVFEDLGTYMASLRKMVAFNASHLGPSPLALAPGHPASHVDPKAEKDADEEDEDAYAASVAEHSTRLKYTTLYPGHGPTVPHEHVAVYLKHRADREQQILAVLAREPPALPARNGNWTTWGVVRNIYRGLPGNMAEAAAHSTTLHLQKLQGDGRVERVSGEGFDVEWRFHGSSEGWGE